MIALYIEYKVCTVHTRWVGMKVLDLGFEYCVPVFLAKYVSASISLSLLKHWLHCKAVIQVAKKKEGCVGVEQWEKSRT